MATVVFSPDGTRFAAERMDTTIYVWDVPSGQKLFSWQLAEQGRAYNEPGHVALSFSPDGKSLASAASYEGPGGRQMVREVVVWDLTTGKATWRAKGGASGFHALAFSDDGKLVAPRDKDGVMLLHTATGHAR